MKEEDGMEDAPQPPLKKAKVKLHDPQSNVEPGVAMRPLSNILKSDR